MTPSAIEPLSSPPPSWYLHVDMLLFCREQWQMWCWKTKKKAKKKKNFNSIHVGYIWKKTDLNPVQGYIELFHFKLFYLVHLHKCGPVLEQIQWYTLRALNTWPVRLVDLTGRGFIQITVIYLSTVLDETSFWIKGKMAFVYAAWWFRVSRSKCNAICYSSI